MPTALIILAPGFEEIEAITTIDLLRRAEFNVTVAGTIEGPITASRQTRHLADTTLDSVKNNDFDIVILPGGGEGTENLKKDSRVEEILVRQKKKSGWIAAICAAPTVLQKLGLIEEGQKVVCHPSTQKQIPAAQLDSKARVVKSGKLITSLAAGSAIEFGYAIIEALGGKEAVQKVNQGVCATL